MASITAPKSGPLNWLEGFALTATLQGFPIFAAASLMVKLLGDDRGGQRVLTVVMATLLYSVLVIWLGRFPKLKNGYEASFFDASLSFSEKIARWRAKPATSVQLVASVLLLSLLAVSVG
ncbi:hypothetical protein [Bradyrhizobium cosmicum]|uniref:Uncharacterized protein n=1 Tax=Bradyrhizobium cosmicum TaxID=1404864 RepID=A0AAI8QEZ3_9BRAD|nr:hypothetical protein [Bradyrhizobium cosmicum]BAL79238.1 hypothetical protein S23_60500 [Bradyrhizobium cosmicum]